MSNRYSSKKHFRLSLAAAYIAAGCGVTAPRSEPAALDVQGSRTSLATGFAVRNIGTQVVFVSRCGDHVLPEIERHVGNEWVNAAAAVCPAVFPMVPIRLEAGVVLRDSVTISVTGTYRLRVAILVGSPSAGPEIVASPSFAIE
jgi:hypothetical protein